MILALSTMSPEATALFYIAAVVILLVAAFAPPARFNLVAVGLALFIIPAAYNALAAT